MTPSNINHNFKHLKHSRVHPKFLHTNSTSHRWVFGAIAELLDNAMDPDANANQVMLDLVEMKDQLHLIIMDNGFGMTVEKLHRMLGFGHSEKTSNILKGRKAIGRYGNGFKSGSMRIGKDALILTKCKESQSVGLLSQSFLLDIKAEDVFIPLLSWNLDGKLLNKDVDEVKEGLEAISKYSIFDSEEEIKEQFKDIKTTGTMIIISNLRKVDGDNLELELDAEEHDIRIRGFHDDEKFQQVRTNQATSVKVPLDFSLRSYCSVLYKIPKMQIFLVGKKVHSKRMSGLLSDRMADSYKPHGTTAIAKYEFGFNTESTDLYGVMMYHNNRLIRPYVRVGIQLEANEKGVGVLGIVDADFLKPTHNKQNFDDTKEYRALIRKMAETLQVFWWDKVESVEKESTSRNSRSTRKKIPDVLWVQCEYPECLKWRTLPKDTDRKKLPKVWYCKFHPNKAIAESNHEYPEESWEDQFIVERTRKRKKEFQAQKKAQKAQKLSSGLDLAGLGDPDRLKCFQVPGVATGTSAKADGNTHNLPPSGRADIRTLSEAMLLYTEWFQLLDRKKDGKVAMGDCLAFFCLSRLHRSVIAQVWGEVIRDNKKAFLHFAEFVQSMRLLAFGQQSKCSRVDQNEPVIKINMPEAHAALSSSNFNGIPTMEGLIQFKANFLSKATKLPASGAPPSPTTSIDTVVNNAGEVASQRLASVGASSHANAVRVKMEPAFTSAAGQNGGTKEPNKRSDLEKHHLDLGLSLVLKGLGKAPERANATNERNQAPSLSKNTTTAAVATGSGGTASPSPQTMITPIAGTTNSAVGEGTTRQEMTMMPHSVLNARVGFSNEDGNGIPSSQAGAPGDLQGSAQPAVANSGNGGITASPTLEVIVPSAQHQGSSMAMFNASDAAISVEDKLTSSITKLRECLTTLYSLSQSKGFLQNTGGQVDIKRAMLAMSAADDKLVHINVDEFLKVIGLDGSLNQ